MHQRSIVVILFQILAMSATVYSQQLRIRGTVQDTITSSRSPFDQTYVILNDTLVRGYPAYRIVKNKRKPEKLTMAEAVARHVKDSIAKERWHDLHKDTRFVVSPDKENKFEIMANISDSLIFQRRSFITQRHAVKDLIRMEKIDIRLQPKICEPEFECDETNPKLYVIIAEKIDAKYREQYYCPVKGSIKISMDTRYDAKYKVLSNIYGSYSKDTIDFTTYDHYGTPKFLSYKYVMLFISEHCGRLFHEKYQYFDVYPTADGRWARPGDPYRFDKKIPQTVTVQKLKFKEPVSFDISNEYMHIIKEEYPEPYFKITRNKAYPLTGVYSDVLFEIKKQGILKARGFDF